MQHRASQSIIEGKSIDNIERQNNREPIVHRINIRAVETTPQVNKFEYSLEKMVRK